MKEIAKVRLNFGIRIFLNKQAARCMLHKKN